MKKKLITLVIGVVACVCALAGCGATEKTFEKAGMRITLTSAFYEQEHIAQTATYVSSSAIVVATKESFTLLAGLEDYTLEDYTDLTISANNLTSDKNYRENKDYIYFTYERVVDGKDFFYLATTHKSPDAFWLIQFACNVSDKESKTETFLKWADTITFVTEATV